MLALGSTLVLVSSERSYDPTKGLTITDTWQGTPTAITDKANSLTNPYLAWAISDRDKPTWTLTIVSPDDVSYQTIWEVHANDLQKPIYEHPEVMAAGRSNLDVVKAYFQDKKETDPIPSTGSSPALTGSADAIAIAQEAWRLQKKGTTHFFIPRFVLRGRVIGTLAGFSGAIFDPGLAGGVFTQSSLMPGGAYDLGLPAPIASFISSIDPDEIPAAPDDYYKWGWLFRTPSLTGLPGGKFELRQEWWLDGWSRLLYDEIV